MLLFDKIDILISSKIVILLQQNGIIFVLIKVENCLQILLIKVFVLKLPQHNVSFLGFSESCEKHIQIMLHLLRGLGVDFGGYAFDVLNGSSFEGFDELVIVLECPIAESLRNLLVILIFYFLRNLLVVFLHVLDLETQFLQASMIWVELKFVHFPYLESLVRKRSRLILLSFLVEVYFFTFLGFGLIMEGVDVILVIVPSSSPSLASF